MPITMAYRTETPDTGGCCAAEPEDPPRLAFCVRPCACRDTHYRLVPKASDAPPSQARIAIISDVMSRPEFNRIILALCDIRGLETQLSISDIKSLMNISARALNDRRLKTAVITDQHSSAAMATIANQLALNSLNQIRGFTSISKAMAWLPLPPDLLPLLATV